MESDNSEQQHSFLKRMILRYRKSTRRSNELDVPPDGGYGWVVLVASFFLVMVVDGIAFSFGVLYPEILKEFDAGGTRTSMVGSLLNGMYLLAGPFASILSARFGHRVVAIVGSIITAAAFVGGSYAQSVEVLMFTYGFCGGVGFSFMYLTSMVITGEYFLKRRPLAVGLAACGSGVGIFAVSAASGALLSIMSWRDVVRIHAGCMMIGVIAGSLFRPLRLKAKKVAGESPCKRLTRMLDLKLFKYMPFLMLTVIFLLGTIGIGLPFVYLPDLALERGFADESSASFLVSLMGITNTVGRVVVGIIAYKFRRINPLFLVFGASVVGGVLSILSFLYTDYVGLATYAGLFGLVHALDATLIPIILAKTLGADKLSNSFGFMCLFRGIAVVTAGPLAGRLFDMTGNYDATFYFSGVCLVVSGIFCVLTWLTFRIWKRRRATRDAENASVNVGDASVSKAVDSANTPEDDINNNENGDTENEEDIISEFTLSTRL